jgi:hypothetical protein
VQDIRRAFVEGRNTVNIQSVAMINFAKWIKFHFCVMDVFRHKPPDVSRYRRTEASALAYLEGQLRDVSVGSSMDQRLEELSSWLKQKEESISEQNLSRLYAVGMN